MTVTVRELYEKAKEQDALDYTLLCAEEDYYYDISKVEIRDEEGTVRLG